jgi:predicted SpoU family rRNA methylase
MENKAIYAKGLYFNKNHKDTPEAVKKWKKGGVAIHIENFATHLDEVKHHSDEKGYIKYDLVENEKDGEKFLSFKLNTYKKEVKPEDVVEDLAPEDSPF